MEGGSGQHSAPPSSSIDKSRILDIKPLRSLAPVFPTSAQALSSGQYPSGVSWGIPAPIRSFRSPIVVEAHPSEYPGAYNVDNASPMEGFNDFGHVDNQKRGVPNYGSSKSYQKKRKKCQALRIDSSSLVGISQVQREDGNREVVNHVLMTFDALRRRLSQLEDSKELSTGLIKRADLKVGNTLLSQGIRTNMKRRIGVVPGVEIGDIFFFRMELCVVGLHAPSMAGIDYMTVRGEFEEEPVALSIVSSGEYDDDAEDSDILIYSGQGGNLNKKDKQVADQKLERGNLALDRSSRRKNEVRVIRGLRDSSNPNLKIYVYDGLYKIQQSWIDKGKSGSSVFKYKLVRMPGQPSAFAFWKSIQKWKAGFPSRTGLILADLASGDESIPVTLVNDVDDEKAPGYFTYFHSLRHPKSFSLMQPSNGCNCGKECIPGDLNCSCIRRNEGDFPYTGNGILVSRKQFIYECGPTCQCFPNCKNRVSQTGLKHHMEVFKTKDRGWGLRSLDPIRSGAFICEYGGEVIDRAKVSQSGEDRDNDEYVFDATRIYNPFKWNYEPRLLEEVSSNNSSEDYTIPSSFIISAKNVGNVARFINHSCSPNVFWQPVLYEENNQSYLHIAFFALRHIPLMTELTYDYGISCSDRTEGSSASMGRQKCLCGSPNCRGSFG